MTETTISDKDMAHVSSKRVVQSILPFREKPRFLYLLFFILPAVTGHVHLPGTSVGELEASACMKRHGKVKGMEEETVCSLMCYNCSTSQGKIERKNFVLETVIQITRAGARG
jgi:hypothetical protein